MWLFESIAQIKDYRERLVTHSIKKYALRPLSKITHIAIHHSFTERGSAETFARYYVNNKGWPGIGYHFVIEQDGIIKWCHDPTTISYHVGNSNSLSIGICMIGDFRYHDPGKAQFSSLNQLVKKLMLDLDIEPLNVWGHNEFPGYEWKECPCIDMHTFRENLITKPKLRYNDVKIPLPSSSRVLRSELFGKEAMKYAHLSPGLLKALNPQKPEKVSSEEVITVRENPSNYSRLPNEIQSIYKMMRNKDYAFFEKSDKDYNLNIIGIRSSDSKVDVFNDSLYVIWLQQNRWIYKKYQVTTDPGLYYLKNPINKAGTAILRAGQYRSAYMLGRHQKKYEALVQAKPVTVIRDYNLDTTLDFKRGQEQIGLFGINIHRANQNWTSTAVNKWSAGCQVFANPNEYREFIKLCKLALDVWGNSFTYTLLEER